MKEDDVVSELMQSATLLHPPFFLPFEAYAEQTLGEFKVTLRNASSKVLSEVSIGDLCAMSEYPNGLYFFFSMTPSALQYVGKCTSRSFIERVPAHFDQREKAWFNTLPTKLMGSGRTYAQALADALKFRVVLLGIKDGRCAAELERVFRHTYRPKLNTPKMLRDFNERASLAMLAGYSSEANG